jgi:hypothetical protein
VASEKKVNKEHKHKEHNKEHREHNNDHKETKETKEHKEHREHKEKEPMDRSIKIKLNSPRGSQPRSPRGSSKPKETKEGSPIVEKDGAKEASPTKTTDASNEPQSLMSPRRNLSPETEALLTLEQQFTSRAIEKVLMHAFDVSYF